MSHFSTYRQQLDVTSQAQEDAELVEQAIRPIQGSVHSMSVTCLDDSKTKIERRVLDAAADAELVASRETLDVRQQPAVDVVGFLHGGKELFVHAGRAPE